MMVRTADSLKDLEKVWRLTHDIYLAEGYALPQPGGLLRQYPHLDLVPETRVFMVEDENGDLLGSNSYTVDGPAGLHADEDFKDVVDGIREDCRRGGLRLGCSWRIVTRPNYRGQLAVAMKLISATLDSGRHVADTVLYMFNPKHGSFYGRMLGLKTIAGPRPCHSVKTSVILMRGEMSEMLAHWERVVARRSSARLAPAANV
jgi:hypothetical protein